jgi:hypothetical protein
MTAHLSSWRLGLRLWFLFIAVVANAVLAVWFLLPAAQPAPAVEEKHQPEEKQIEFKARIQAVLAKETAEQSIEHLPDFDDVVPTMACLGNNMGDGADSTYVHAVKFYPNLNRVRKIVEEGREKPDRVVPILKEKLAHAMDDYKRIIVAYGIRVNRGGGWIRLMNSRNDKYTPLRRCTC